MKFDSIFKMLKLHIIFVEELSTNLRWIFVSRRDFRRIWNGFVEMRMRKTPDGTTTGADRLFAVPVFKRTKNPFNYDIFKFNTLTDIVYNLHYHKYLN
jgi:hypothetical protein